MFLKIFETEIPKGYINFRLLYFFVCLFTYEHNIHLVKLRV